MPIKEIYEKQQKLSLLQFIIGIPKFVMALISAIASSSAICFFDTVDSLGYTIDSAFMFFTSKKLKKDVKNKYNYGIGKVEAISSIFCDILVIGGLIAILIYSIYRIIVPVTSIKYITTIVILKLISVAFDIFLVISQALLRKSNKSKITECEFFKVLGAFAFDMISFFSLYLTYYLKDYPITQYFPFVLALPIIIYLFIDCIKRIKESIQELTDKTISKEKQNIIKQIINNYKYGYQQVISINTRQVNNQIYVDLVMNFDSNMEYSKIKSLCEIISLDINSQIPNSKVTIRITDKQI